MDDKSANTKWAAIKTGSGRITGYIEVFRTTGDKWVTIPGASRFADASARESHPYSEIANGSAA